MKALMIIDGGTTNLRVTLLNAEMKELASAKAEGGVKHTAIDGHNGRLRSLLKDCMEQVLAQSGLTYADVAGCAAYGMITSGLGLLEIPHNIAPASPADLRSRIQIKRFEDIAPLDIAFIPGVKNHGDAVNSETVSAMDMMRGEETESIGLYQLLGLKQEALLVLPGSHNKLVHMDAEGRILGCMTSISGELLDAITHHTILAGSVESSFCTAETYQAEYAIRGAKECMESGIGRAAFDGRILQTLGKAETGAVQSWLLGAVLAEDVKAMEHFTAGAKELQIYIAGKPPIQQALCDILSALGKEHVHSVSRELSAKMGTLGAVHIMGWA